MSTPAASTPPPIGTRFRLPPWPVEAVGRVVWQVTSTTPDLVRYRPVDDPRVGKRASTMSLVEYLRDATPLEPPRPPHDV